MPIEENVTPILRVKDAAAAAAWYAGLGFVIVSTRVLKAPVDRVFTAWTDPKILASWFGPKGFTCTFSEFEPRPGGWWRFVMHGPDGKDYENESLFLEVVPNERIAFDHVSGPKFRATVTLTPAPQGTQILWSMLFATAKEYEAVKGFAVEANQQNLDKLEAALAK